MKKLKELSYEDLIQLIDNGGLKISMDTDFCFTTSYKTRYFTGLLEIHRNPIKCSGISNKMVAHKEVKPLFEKFDLDFDSLKKEFPGLTIVAKNVSCFKRCGSIFAASKMVAFFIFSG